MASEARVEKPPTAVQMGPAWQARVDMTPAPSAPRRRRQNSDILNGPTEISGAVETPRATESTARNALALAGAKARESKAGSSMPGPLKLLAPIFDTETYRSALYLLLSFPVGLFYVVMLTTLVSVGFALMPILVGFAILLATLGLIRLSGGVERWMIATVLERRIAEPPRVAAAGGFGTQVKTLATDMVTWRTGLWLLLRFPIGIAGLVLVSGVVALPILAVVRPLVIFAEGSDGFGVSQEIFGYLIFLMFAMPATIAGAWLIRASGGLISQFAAALLGPSMQERAEKLEARTHVLEERTQLAHELHDSVGHAMTAVTLQAGAAEHVFDKDPEFARQALHDIRNRGERALGELDRILGQLSDNNDAARAPLPGFDRLNELVVETRRAGLPVGAVFNGDPASVPDDIGRTVYRVVQEALTNVMKHAGQVETAVVVDITPYEVHVEVENQRRAHNGARAFSGGRGLIGLRERVIAGGGTFNTGPTAVGGYLVSARIPVQRKF